MRRAILPFVILLCLLAVYPGQVMAQNGQVTLVGRALVDAAETWNGPASGQAFGNKVINGISFPRTYQPVGSFSGIIASEDPGQWYVLSTGSYGNQSNSKDFFLAIQVIQLSLPGANPASVIAPIKLGDPKKKVKANIVNASSSGRWLTGADFNPQAFARAADGSFWIAEGYGPSLLHFNASGQLLDAPIPLSGAGDLQGMGILPDGAVLLIAQKNGGGVVFREFDINSRRLGGALSTYALSGGAQDVSDVTVISSNQALIIEQDNGQGANAKVKQIYLADFTANPATKTLVADLLNIADPNAIGPNGLFAKQQPAGAFGVSGPFKFPYMDVSGVVPLDAQTLLVVNNNHLPQGTARDSKLADSNDFIAIQLAQPLPLGN